MLQVARTSARARRGYSVVVNYQKSFPVAFFDAASGATDLRRKIEDAGVQGVTMPEVSVREGREDSRM
jgi:hypothetical protein